MPSNDLNERMNEVPELSSPALILMCSYRGAARAPAPEPALGFLGQVKDILTLGTLGRFVAQWRDFYANPRSYDYQSGLVEAAAARCRAGAELVIDAAFGAELASPAHVSITSVSRRDLRQISAGELPTAATVILVYPDPLGLSWQNLEAVIRKQGRSVVVVNGRRRMFLLNDEARRALRLRRFLANTRVAELVGGLLLIPAAGLLALRDRMAGRS